MRDSSNTLYYRWSPRAGVVFQPIEDVLSLYGSYSRSFDLVQGSQANGNALKPELGEQYEIGIKTNFLEQMLSVRISGFYLTKDNVAVPDPLNNLFFLQIGQQRSQGLETSVIGNLSERWSVVANYASRDTRNTEDSRPAFVGKPFRGVPHNTGSLWTRYDVLKRNR